MKAIQFTEIPLPSIQEQKQIVQSIESRFSVCDMMEGSIAENLQKAEALRQSILRQAFEGNLTEQWRREHKDLISGENSAEALLKKIKAEKEALQVKPKGKKKR
jgi:type I restriction enzyme S subunit